jgi:hypothetical protein
MASRMWAKKEKRKQINHGAIRLRAQKMFYQTDVPMMLSGQLCPILSKSILSIADLQSLIPVDLIWKSPNSGL